ncbi:MAG TPA: LytR family transcriptional regulator [Proteiniclasticum sp.]|uniref:LCP family protein n=1 Tax=Proteiniclasticum sp. TaxID=2053595 RepID=UPI000E8D9C09|nr:LCP family protein [Proteiniclasticum sp.]HBW13345.1 LytR family transcriptional regulator [Proteiniclasticum sp.]
MTRREYKKTKKKKRNVKTPLLITLAVLLFLTGFGYAYVHNLLNSTIKEEIPQGEGELGIGDKEFEFEYEEGIEIPGGEDDGSDLPYYYEEVKGITNIALFGVDAPLGKRGRSDAIMIVTIDRNSKKIKLSSIIRDSYVNIPDRGMDKVNHAYAFGGPELALKTLNSNFHLDIRNFATVNFTTLPKVIDTLGGVSITVTNAEATQIAGISKGGTYTLTGEQALSYVRIRKIDSDFARSDRQRTVIEAIIKKMLDKPVTSYPGILSKILPLITTNMGSNDILSLAGSVVTNGIRTVDQMRFPEDSYSSGQTIKGIYYYVFNRDSAVRSIGSYIYLDEKTSN